MTKKEMLDKIFWLALDLSVQYRLDGDEDLAGYWYDVAADAKRCNHP